MWSVPGRNVALAVHSLSCFTSTCPPPHYLLSLGNTEERHTRKEAFCSHRGSADAVPGWLLTLTLFGGSGFAVGSLPRLVVVERGAVLAVGPCCVVLAHAFPMDLVGEREQG